MSDTSNMYSYDPSDVTSQPCGDDGGDGGGDATAGNQITQIGLAEDTITELSEANDSLNDIETATEALAAQTAATSFFAAVLNDVDLSVKASAGHLRSIFATNQNAAIRWLQVHNKATAPANPDVPILSVPIPSGSVATPGWAEIGKNVLDHDGLACSTGIAVGISTTAATFTAATPADHTVLGKYV